VLPGPDRTYADRQTQAVFDAWNAGAARVARMRQVELFPEPTMKPKHDPGGKVRLALTLDVKSSAVFGDPADCYRYRLQRTWDETKPHVMFVMMNPSTADPLVDDPTVAKCGRFARAWGYGGIFVGNTFAYRATDQKRLMQVDDPIGPDNDAHIIEMAQLASVVVFAYGQPCYASLKSRGLTLERLLVDKAGVAPLVLRLAKNGTPWHPFISKRH
jgi:hypothetical protein